MPSCSVPVFLHPDILKPENAACIAAPRRDPDILHAQLIHMAGPDPASTDIPVRIAFGIIRQELRNLIGDAELLLIVPVGDFHLPDCHIIRRAPDRIPPAVAGLKPGENARELGIAGRNALDADIFNPPAPVAVFIRDIRIRVAGAVAHIQAQIDGTQDMVHPDIPHRDILHPASVTGFNGDAGNRARVDIRQPERAVLNEHMLDGMHGFRPDFQGVHDRPDRAVRDMDIPHRTPGMERVFQHNPVIRAGDMAVPDLHIRASGDVDPVCIRDMAVVIDHQIMHPHPVAGIQDEIQVVTGNDL